MNKKNDQIMKELEGHLGKLKNDSDHIGDMIRCLAEAAIAGCQVLVATMKISGTDVTDKRHGRRHVFCPKQTV